MKKVYLNVGERGACSYYRSILPDKELRSVLSLEGIELTASEQLMDFDYDVFLFHRNVHPNFLSVLERLKGEGKKIVIDFDDDMWSIPVWNPAYSTDKVIIDSFEWTLEIADEVWVSTDELKSVVSCDKGKVRVLPNLVDVSSWDFVKDKEEDGKVRVLWSGSVHHDADLQMVVPCIERLLLDERIEVIFFGSYPEELADWARIRMTNLAVGIPGRRFGNRLKFISPVDIHLYPETLSRIGADIGIAPLCNHKFNNSKSNIKYLEYSLAGLVTVASDLPPYRCIENGKDGYLVSDVSSMYDRVMELVEDGGKRKRMLASAKRKVVGGYSWDSRKNVWLEAIRSVL